ncbi:FMN-binding protein [Isachenkonia alkalipeptolytica]|uniref:FMN-binding protein n=1 Tax=Isachenkonia alkalipeptolytica TaxID=2565777 RepID=A0AA43XJT1_9CLOT|nr:FMN-binding protein [Isachenkonia alkalipeptolytica]NBG88210.1 FMN-binding protein [Isachenkonia alkalipeptolytica]
MKKWKKVLIGAGLVVGVVGLVMLFFVTRGLDEGKALVIHEVNLQNLEDGIYPGEYDGVRWKNEVEVEVLDGKIQSIRLVDGFEMKKVKKEIYEKVIEHQSLEVEVVSGATVSSKAYLKAIENALIGE